jgi:uncharacterized protein (TIGR03000 family)
MYSVMLMAALATGANAPDCHYPGSCYSCGGGYYSHGCCGYSYGCCGGSYAHGCCGGYSYGCGGCYGSYAYGCGGGWAAIPASSATLASTDKVGDPKKAGTTVGRLFVALPAEAKLFVDGQLMKSASDRRTMLTPELEPGRQYYYDLRAEVTIDGKTETETQRVIVQGGVTAEASFSKLTAAVQASKALAANK